MKLSTAKRRINKTLDELCKSVVDDWYANFKNGYIKGYEDARQGKSPMYAEAYKVADTPQTKICDTCKYRSSNVFGNWCVGRDTCDRYEADTPQAERSVP